MTSFARPTRSFLIAQDKGDLNARVPGADSRVRRTFLSALATMHGGAMDGAYGYLDWIADQIMPDSADSAHLERWASFWGIFRKAATAATGTAAGTGTNGVDVPAGTVLQRGDLVQYVTTADAVVAGGLVDVALAASIPGTAGLADAGVQLSLISPIAGLSSLFLVDAGGLIGGTDAETDAELLSRLEARIQNPPKGGGPGDYVAWATEMPGVTRAWEYPLWNGLGTVGVAFVFDDRADIFPLAADVTAMQAWLDGLAPVTAAVTAFAPLQLVANFTVHLDPDTPAIRAAVIAELADLFTREATPGGPILRSHYDQAIGLGAGASDYAVTVPAGDIDPAAYTLATLGVVTWV